MPDEQKPKTDFPDRTTGKSADVVKLSPTAAVETPGATKTCTPEEALAYAKELHPDATAETHKNVAKFHHAWGIPKETAAK